MKYIVMINKLLRIVLAATALICAVGCGHRYEELDFESIYTPRYASGFEILASANGTNTLIITRNPWQGAEDFSTSLMIVRDGTEPPKNFDGQVIYGNATHIVCMSSSHVAMLDAVGAVGSVVGTSGVNYICNQYIARNRNSIPDIGYDGNIDYETLVALAPDLVILYGVTGASPMEPKLRELGIPYIYVGEYIEESPLGKAEWMVAVAELVGLREEAIKIFDEIPERYDNLKLKVKSADLVHPKVMLNVPYADSWFMASTDSYIALLIADAGGDYIYTKNTSGKSLPIDIEEAFLLASEADIWLNVNDIRSIGALKSRLPNFADVRCVQNGAVFNCDRRVNEFGGNDYWESAVVHPDVVLRDMVKIMHPELVDEDLVYYRQLPE